MRSLVGWPFRRYLFVTAAWLAIAAWPVTAGLAHAESLTLRQAVARALQGNVDLKREGLVLRQAEANIVAQLGYFDVTLEGDATFRRLAAPPAGIDSRGTFLQERIPLNLSLYRNLETGGQLRLQGFGERDINNEGQISHQASGALVFTHPLLRGFGREVTEANLRKARITRDQELFNRQARAANVLRDTIIAYWELAYQSADLEIRRSAVALAEQQLKTTEAQIQVGRMGELQAAAVRRAIADDQQEVEASLQRELGRGLDLLRLIGQPVPAGFARAGLQAADAALAQPHEVDADAETARALAASPALKALQTGIALSDVDVAVAASSLRPRLDLTASIGKQAVAPGIDDLARELPHVDQTIGTAGLIFSLPLQNRAARGAAESARAAVDASRLTAFDLELAIRDGVARLASQIRSASRRIDLAAASVKYAQQNLDAEKARFSVGQSTNNDVLLRQQELKQAQISGARAAVDLLEADVALAALTGDVLETYGVILRGM